jgi:hypothetical protein
MRQVGVTGALISSNRDGLGARQQHSVRHELHSGPVTRDAKAPIEIPFTPLYDFI